MVPIHGADGLHGLEAREVPMRMYRRGGWTFGVLWTLATTAGWAAGWGIGEAAGEVEGGVVSAISGGMLSGALQWPALRGRMRWAL